MSAVEKAIEDARAAKLNVSLLLVGVIALGSYGLGRYSFKEVADVQQTANEKNLDRVVKAIEAFAEVQKITHAEQVRGDTQSREQLHKLTVEIETLRSHVVDKKR